MLDPNQRSLYTAMLTPPPGYVLEDALGTTYSLDIETLLTVPAHLALLGDAAHGDGIAVFESLRRVIGRLSLYVQRGRMLAPRCGSELYGLLAPSVVEVEPPGGGVFHPKIWALRFLPADGVGTERLRVAVLTRNVTEDRAWDLSLQLEGEVGRERLAANRPLARLIRRLPDMAPQGLDEVHRQRVRDIAYSIVHCGFELPEGVSRLQFDVPGLNGRRWRPDDCDRLAVISPFCSDEALAALAGSSAGDAVLITRPDTLAALKPATRNLFSGCWVLHDAAEIEDGEDPGGAAQDRHGLHAKVYIAEKGARTRVTVGSANATNAALVAAHNIEVLVTLEGPRRRLGGVDTLLGEDGLGGVLLEWPVSDTEPDSDPEAEAVQRRLEAARSAIVDAGLRVGCDGPDANGQWRILLRGGVALPDAVEARVWPVSRDESTAVRLDASDEVGELLVGRVGPAHVTAVLAFDLKDAAGDERLRFALNLPVEGLPEAEREAAILRAVMNNHDGFMRYLMLLLASEEDTDALAGLSAGAGAGGWFGTATDDLPLLEELTRAYCRDPDSLREIARIVQRLRDSDGAGGMIPPAFERVWQVYEQALERDGG